MRRFLLSPQTSSAELKVIVINAIADVREKCVAVCSSGLDSTSSATYFVRDNYHVILLHFNYGQLAEPAEHERIGEIAKYLNTSLVEVDGKFVADLGGSPLTDDNIDLPKGFASVFSLGCWVPARNVVFLSYAAALAERVKAKTITFGAESSESHYSDNTPEFVKRFNSMLELGCQPPAPQIVTPFARNTKAEIMKWGLKHGVPYHLTWSCDQAKMDSEPNYIHCGECGCCNSRRYAHYVNKVEDKQPYLNDEYFRQVFLPELKEKQDEVAKVMKKAKY